MQTNSAPTDRRNVAKRGVQYRYKSRGEHVLCLTNSDHSSDHYPASRRLQTAKYASQTARRTFSSPFSGRRSTNISSQLRRHKFKDEIEESINHATLPKMSSKLLAYGFYKREARPPEPILYYWTLFDPHRYDHVRHGLRSVQRR